MSQFSKSIFYSGIVLAIGLIAIFSIYDATMDQNEVKMVNIANIEPAAGIAREENVSQAQTEANRAATVTSLKFEENDIAETLNSIKTEAGKLGQAFVDYYIYPDPTEKTKAATAK